MKNIFLYPKIIILYLNDYIYVYIYPIFTEYSNAHLYSLIYTSSSCRAGSTDIPDPLSPLLPIVHRPRQVFRTTSRILT